MILGHYCVMEIKLKPCPFCGGEATFDCECNEDGYPSDILFVTCKQCHSRTEGIHDMQERTNDFFDRWHIGMAPYLIEARVTHKLSNITAREKLAKMWNRRK